MIDYSRLLFVGDGGKHRPLHIIRQHVGLEKNTERNRGS
jgi:hypothetical protein